MSELSPDRSPIATWALGDAPSGWPTVSVVMPIRNEEPHLEHAVAAVLAQDYPRAFDVCLAVAPSSDASEAIAARLDADDTRVHVVANPSGLTPTGLNAAIRVTDGEVVVRVDGHSGLSAGYIRRAVETMARTGAVNVGGVQAAVGETPFEDAVAAATTSWFGTGGATYRVGGSAGPVDTVYLGVFNRAAGDAVGWFDETLLRNQDYEFNIRLRNAGGTIWFDPELSVEYRPRGSFAALAQQYFEYGWWKAQVVRRHPRSLRIRQIVAVVVPPVVGVSAVVGIRRPRLAVGAVVYAVADLLAARGAAHPRHASAAKVMAIFPVQHAAWSVGFMVGFLRTATSRRRSSVAAAGSCLTTSCVDGVPAAFDRQATPPGEPS